MFRISTHLALLCGALVSVPGTGQAGPGNPYCDAACTVPSRRIIQTTECVPETYQVTRTAYRVECRQECYEAFRCVTVPECRERQVTVVKRVPYTTYECRKVAKKVTEYETRTVCKPVCKTIEETVQEKRLVSLGCWDTKEVCVPSCDPCCPPKKVCVKYWRYCPQYECVPVTVCKKVTVDVQCQVQVPVCRTIYVDEKYPVCSYRDVPETVCEKYTVNVVRKVPYQATRCVRVWVPYQECVTLTRMVQRVVCREVCVNTCVAPCATPAPCAPACDSYGARARNVLVANRGSALAVR